MTVYVDHNQFPVYDIPGQILYLDGDNIMESKEGLRRIYLPMQEVWSSTSWDEVYDQILAMTDWSVGDVAIAYRSLAVMSGADSTRIRYLDLGIMYDVPRLSWGSFPSLARWWASLNLHELDQRSEWMLQRKT